MKEGSNYPSFDKQLRIDFGRIQPSSKSELSILMMQFKYRVKNGNKVEPKPLQLDYAWDFIQRELVPRQERIETFFKKEKYNDRYVYRATKEQVINGKTYKKGWFIPRR